MSTSDVKKPTPPVFKRDVVRAMSPLSREVADMLEAAGLIRITDDAEATA